MNQHLNRFANLVILELSMLSLCALVRDSFSLLLPPETFLWLGLLCLLLWIAESFRYGALIGLPFSAAVLWYLYQNRSVDLIEEAQDLLERISAVYYGHYSASSAAASVEGLSAPVRDTGAFPPPSSLGGHGGGAGCEPGGRPSAEYAGVLLADFQPPEW